MAYGLKLSISIQILGFNVLIILFTLSGVTGDRKSGLLYFFTKKKCKNYLYVPNVWWCYS